MIRRIGFLICGLLAIVVLTAAVAGVVLVRMDLRPWIESYAGDKLGRKLTIEAVSIGWGDPIMLELRGMRLANPAWGSTPDMVSIGRLHAAVALWPLLHGVLNLSGVVAERPVIVLERNTDGTGNWVFPALGARPPAAVRPPTPPPAHFISDMRLQDGTLTFRTTERHLLRVRVDDAQLRAANDAAPVILHAEGAYNDLNLVADVTVQSFAALRQAPHPVATDIHVAAKRTTVKLNGTMTDPLGFDGIEARLDLAAETPEELAAIFGTATAMDGKLALTGMLDKHGDHWRLTDASGIVAGATATGTLGLDEGKRGQPDHFDIDLDFPTLDLQRLAGTSANSGQKGFPLHVEEKPGETYTARIGIRNAIYGHYRLDAVALEASVEPARIRLGKLAFGFADGRVDLSGSNEAAGTGGHLMLDAVLSQINAARLMAMLGADTSMLAGRLDARASLEMTGKTTQDALGASRGQAVLSMTGGQVSRQFLELASIDLRLLLRKGQGSASVTCFLAVADLRNGVASLAPLRLKTREGNLSGGGQLDLRRDAVDLYLRSEGGSTKFWALDIPLHLTGSLANPRAEPMILTRAPAQDARGAANLRLLPPDLRQLASASRC